MYQLLESIYLKDGVFRNLHYHEARMRASALALNGTHLNINLASLLAQQLVPAFGMYKTRILYTKEIDVIEFVPYRAKPVHSIKLIHDDHISYSHKLSDRTRLTELYALRGVSDDILIVKNELITDSYYGNVVFKQNNVWYTPQSYLLKGTMRQSLLEAGLIKEADISLNNYMQFESLKIINAMLGMESQEIPVTAIS
jgi:4-amino-4-deoxychorismate lyase